jgi:hypothetical protein
MDELQRQKIRKLRVQGYGYLRISNLLEISPSTIRSFCKKEKIAGLINTGEQLRGKDNLTICKQCGKKFYQIAGRKNKTFCSTSCCKVYWTLNKDKQRRLVPEKYNCLICNNEYYEYPFRKRKYCSRDCYCQSKRKVVANDEN